MMVLLKEEVIHTLKQKEIKFLRTKTPQDGTEPHKTDSDIQGV